ncbi:MAG: DUF763 domain-containing protein, partial [Actinobacteria bacterium]|nr:DUF763 domain-containing protein [Actinomycetota bacterium]
LHGGKAPYWLFERMKKLAREMIILIVSEYGAYEFLHRISDPLWFQAFGCVLGFDWHSSGLTTTVCGAIKEAIKGLEKDLGLFVAGGKGKTSRKTPDEIENAANITGIEYSNLIYSSKMVAKVDSSALQDSYQLYHHCFMFTKDGKKWAVIQQGMNEDTRLARRYHWLSENVSNFVCEPHSAICCDRKSLVLNLVATESEEARDAITFLSNEKPEKVIEDLKKINKCIQKKCIHGDFLTFERGANRTNHIYNENYVVEKGSKVAHPLPVHTLPVRHFIKPEDIDPSRLSKILISTYENRPKDFESLLSIKGVGPKTIRALALIAEMVYSTKCSIKDPVRFSFAHGGKDGHPYPVDRESYDLSIDILHKAIKESKIGRTEKIEAIKRLLKF